jgi:hypothetical protein
MSGGGPLVVRLRMSKKSGLEGQAPEERQQLVAEGAPAERADADPLRSLPVGARRPLVSHESGRAATLCADRCPGPSRNACRPPTLPAALREVPWDGRHGAPSAPSPTRDPQLYHSCLASAAERRATPGQHSRRQGQGDAGLAREAQRGAGARPGGSCPDVYPNHGQGGAAETAETYRTEWFRGEIAPPSGGTGRAEKAVPCAIGGFGRQGANQAVRVRAALRPC